MTGHPRPLPRETPLNRPFWDGCRAGILRLQRCLACKQAVFYPRVCCPHCGNGALEWFDASGRGTLASWTVIHRPGHEAFMADVPYIFAAVTLAQGPILYGRLHLPPEQSPLIGAPVQTVFDAATDHVMLPAFRIARPEPLQAA
jgi:uncharacterized OB-fold protein